MTLEQRRAELERFIADESTPKRERDLYAAVIAFVDAFMGHRPVLIALRDLLLALEVQK